MVDMVNVLKSFSYMIMHTHILTIFAAAISLHFNRRYLNNLSTVCMADTSTSIDTFFSGAYFQAPSNWPSGTVPGLYSCHSRSILKVCMSLMNFF